MIKYIILEKNGTYRIKYKIKCWPFWFTVKEMFHGGWKEARDFSSEVEAAEWVENDIAEREKEATPWTIVRRMP